ncbi:MAG: ABC transporter permease subunit [Candidatus Nanopelagicales bacterium]|jgi:putative spermidine/putrescine transport system permease protein
MTTATRRTGSRIAAVGKSTFLILVGLYFVVPMLAMARFAFQNVPTALLTPEKIFTGWSAAGLWTAVTDPQVLSATRTSLLLVVFAIIVNLALLLPLAIVTEVRAPRLRPVLTAVTLLPWVIPPIALVVGVAATFRATVPWFLASNFSLVPFYALWAMPFTYRALDAGLQAIGARTLYEAARSMGASLGTVVFRVLLPNMRAAVVAAGGLTAAMVLGEFAFASLLLKTTLPTVMVDYQRGDPRGGLALALFVMVLTAVALGLVVRTLRRRGMSISTTGL